MTLPVTHRPRTTPVAGPCGSSPFSAPWSSTRELLDREARHLGAREVVLETAHTPGQLTRDGRPRAGSRPPGDPGVVVWLIGTGHGDLSYPCALTAWWEDNVRAVALALEALRKIDRYGVANSGQQYHGFAQLPQTTSAGQGQVARGRELIRQYGSVRAAQKATHPDHGGNPADFEAAQAAAQETTA